MSNNFEGHELYKDLVRSLTSDTAYRPSQLFVLLLEEILYRFGVVRHKSTDLKSQGIVNQCVDKYLRVVRFNEPYTDVLGILYMTLASKWNQKNFGQYFTPQPIARMMAAFAPMVKIPESMTEDCELYRVCDPACGSGVMFLSFLQNVLDVQGKEALQKLSVTGIDIDLTCARMSAVQLMVNWMVHDLPIGEIDIQHGDCLANQSWDTVVHATFVQSTQHLRQSVECDSGLLVS